MRCGERGRDGRSSSDCIAQTTLAQSGNGLKAQGTPLGRETLLLRICGSSVRAILQTQQRLKGNVRGKLWIGEAKRGEEVGVTDAAYGAKGREKEFVDPPTTKPYV